MDIKIDDSFIDDINDKKFNFKKLIIIISIVVLFICLLIVYARYKATSGIVVHEYKVVDSSLPSSFHGTKVVQFSDLYFGNTVDIKYLNKIVDSINEINPDIVVFTGDLIANDASVSDVVGALNRINSKFGNYSIKGDIDGSLYDSVISSSNFIDITNSSVDVFNKGNSHITLTNTDINFDNFSIFLLHQPDSLDSLSNNYNLILAGHSLGGQINIPLVKRFFLQNGAKKYYKSFYPDLNMYVSSGIGTTNFKYRFLNKPSINLYRLCNY